MLKISTIADLLGYKTYDFETEFDDSKDIFFKTITDDYIAILKLDNSKSVIFIIWGNDLGRLDFSYTVEIKNNTLNGRAIYWNEWPDYSEFKDGVLHGYHESAFQNILEERGFYDKGVRVGWWERGDKYEDLRYDDLDDFHKLKDYRAAAFYHYLNGSSSKTYHSISSEYEYKLAVDDEYEHSLLEEKYLNKKIPELTKAMKKKDIKERIKDKVESGEIYVGKYNDYFSYDTYLKKTNLPKLNPPNRDDEMYGWCATSINYSKIMREYSKLLTKKKAYERLSALTEPIQIYLD